MLLGKVINNAELSMSFQTRVLIWAIEFFTGRAGLKRRYFNYQRRAQDLGGPFSRSESCSGPNKDDFRKSMVERLVNTSKCSVLPLIYSGANSELFQLKLRKSLSLRFGFYLHDIRGCLDHAVKFKIKSVLSLKEIPRMSDKSLAQ